MFASACGLRPVLISGYRRFVPVFRPPLPPLPPVLGLYGSIIQCKSHGIR